MRSVEPEIEVVAIESRAAVAETEHGDLRVPPAVRCGLPREADGVRRRAEMLGVDGETAFLFFDEALAVGLGLGVVIGIVGEAVVEDDVPVVVTGVLGACGNDAGYGDDEAKKYSRNQKVAY